MAVLKTYTFADAAVATEFSGGAVASSGNVSEFLNGAFHNKITSHTAIIAGAQDQFGGGTTYTSGVLAVSNWKQDVLWTGGDATNRLQVMILYSSDFTQAASVYLRPSGKMYVHVSGTGILASAGSDSPDTTTTFSAGVAHDLELVWDRPGGTLTLYVDGTDSTATLTGLTGGTGGIGRVFLGCYSDLGATSWTQTVNFYADEMLIDDDKTQRPYSGGAPATPAVPTALMLTAIDDLTATIQFTTVGGHRIVVHSGADTAAPSTPTDSGWSTPATADSSANPTSASTGTVTVPITLAANDTVYTVAVFSYDGTSYSSSSVTTNVFSVAPMAFVALTPSYVVGEIATDLNGMPRFEFNSASSWSQGTADVATFDAHVDGVANYTVFAAAADFTDTANGTALGASGWGTSAMGKRIRLDFTGITGTPYCKGYHGLDGS